MLNVLVVRRSCGDVIFFCSVKIFDVLVGFSSNKKG